MVSVCLTTYNGEAYIYRQISTILGQLNDTDEVLISDDGSSDNTLSLLKSFNDARIKILKHTPRNEKRYKFNLTTRNIENAILHSKGDIIILADQDDEWLPNRINSAKKLLIKYDLVVNDCEIINENNEPVAPSYFEKVNPSDSIIKNFVSSSYLGCCMAFNRKCLKYSLPFPSSPVPHDIWIGLIAKIFNSVYFSSEKVIRYRRHGSNLSASAEESKNSLTFKIQYRFILLYAVCKRYFSIKFNLNENSTNNKIL